MHTCRMREERSPVTNRLVVEEHPSTWLYRPFRSSSSHAACLCSSTYAAWLSLPVVETIGDSLSGEQDIPASWMGTETLARPFVFCGRVTPPSRPCAFNLRLCSVTGSTTCPQFMQRHPDIQRWPVSSKSMKQSGTMSPSQRTHFIAPSLRLPHTAKRTARDQKQQIRRQ